MTINTPQPKEVKIKVGDEVTTVHDEKLKVLAVGEDRNGKKVLAESGGHKTWFPIKKLKTK